MLSILHAEPVRWPDALRETQSRLAQLPDGAVSGVLGGLVAIRD